MITPVRLLLSIVVVLTAGVSAVGAIEIHVSPAGDDASPGTQQKPLASLARARDVVRRQKTENPKEDITVFLRGGVYRLTETVVSTLADSGGAGQRIRILADPTAARASYCEADRVQRETPFDRYPTQRKLLTRTSMQRIIASVSTSLWRFAGRSR